MQVYISLFLDTSVYIVYVVEFHIKSDTGINISL